MSLAAGTRFGPYEILSPLGAGGMGEVYRTRDSKLKREVALKVLPDVFASDPERMTRFQREAEVLAALNHPEVQCEDLREESRNRFGARSVMRSYLANLCPLGCYVVNEVRRLADDSLSHCERPNASQRPEGCC